MAWADRISFEEIKKKTGLSEKEVIKIMRKSLKRKSYILWRKRIKGRLTKHRKLFKSKKQNQILLNDLKVDQQDVFQ